MVSWLDNSKIFEQATYSRSEATRLRREWWLLHMYIIESCIIFNKKKLIFVEKINGIRSGHIFPHMSRGIKS